MAAIPIEVCPDDPSLRRHRHRCLHLLYVPPTPCVLCLPPPSIVSQKDLYPGDQLDQDPKKKTIVVLGNGWGATSFLKSLDNEDYNVVVISPRNYFLFSPLLPSVTVGTLEARSIIQPTRYITRHKKRKCAVYEAEATDVDPAKKTVTFRDASETNEEHKEVTISYDYLVYGVGAENQTFGIKGVKEYGCFLKELKDADKIRRKLLDCEWNTVRA